MATAAVSPAESASAGAGWVHLGFRLGGSVLGLDVADAGSLRLLEDAYAQLLCPPSGRRVRAVLRRLADGRLQVRYGREILRLADAADAVPLRASYHAAREIFARFACDLQRTTAVYGALCAIGGGAVLLLGPTAIGKTLLSLHLSRLGARFLGDETALLSPDAAEIYAMGRRPALRETALPLLPDPDMARSVEQSASCFLTERGRFWYALDADALGGVEPSSRVYPLRAVCVLRRRAERAAIRRIPHADAVKDLTQRAYARPASLAQLGALRRATRHAAFFEMVLGPPAESGELLVREVSSCA